MAESHRLSSTEGSEQKAQDKPLDALTVEELYARLYDDPAIKRVFNSAVEEKLYPKSGLEGWHSENAEVKTPQEFTRGADFLVLLEKRANHRVAFYHNEESRFFRDGFPVPAEETFADQLLATFPGVSDTPDPNPTDIDRLTGAFIIIRFVCSQLCQFQFFIDNPDPVAVASLTAEDLMRARVMSCVPFLDIAERNLSKVQLSGDILQVYGLLSRCLQILNELTAKLNELGRRSANIEQLLDIQLKRPIAKVIKNPLRPRREELIKEPSEKWALNVEHESSKSLSWKSFLAAHWKAIALGVVLVGLAVAIPGGVIAGGVLGGLTLAGSYASAGLLGGTAAAALGGALTFVAGTAVVAPWIKLFYPRPDWKAIAMATVVSLILVGFAVLLWGIPLAIGLGAVVSGGGLTGTVAGAVGTGVLSLSFVPWMASGIRMLEKISKACDRFFEASHLSNHNNTGEKITQGTQSQSREAARSRRPSENLLARIDEEENALKNTTNKIVSKNLQGKRSRSAEEPDAASDVESRESKASHPLARSVHSYGLLSVSRNSSASVSSSTRDDEQNDQRNESKKSKTPSKKG